MRSRNAQRRQRSLERLTTISFLSALCLSLDQQPGLAQLDTALEVHQLGLLLSERRSPAFLQGFQIRDASAYSCECRVDLGAGLVHDMRGLDSDLLADCGGSGYGTSCDFDRFHLGEVRWPLAFLDVVGLLNECDHLVAFERSKLPLVASECGVGRAHVGRNPVFKVHRVSREQISHGVEQGLAALQKAIGIVSFDVDEVLAVSLASFDKVAPSYVSVGRWIRSGEEFTAEGLVVGHELCVLGQCFLVLHQLKCEQRISNSHCFLEHPLLAIEASDLGTYHVRAQRCDGPREYVELMVYVVSTLGLRSNVGEASGCSKGLNQRVKGRSTLEPGEHSRTTQTKLGNGRVDLCRYLLDRSRDVIEQRERVRRVDVVEILIDMGPYGRAVEDRYSSEGRYAQFTRPHQNLLVVSDHEVKLRRLPLRAVGIDVAEDPVVGAAVGQSLEDE